VNGVDGIIHLAARTTFESYQTLKPSILDGSLALPATALAALFRRIRPHPGLKTPGAVRTYNFNLAVDPENFRDVKLISRIAFFPAIP
jgi:hypothetical protein